MVDHTWTILVDLRIYWRSQSQIPSSYCLPHTWILKHPVINGCFKWHVSKSVQIFGNCCSTKLGPTSLHYLHFLLWCSVQFSMCKAPPHLPRLPASCSWRQTKTSRANGPEDSRINRWEWASLASFWLATSSLRSFSKSQPCCDSWVPTSRTGKSWRRQYDKKKESLAKKTVFRWLCLELMTKCRRRTPQTWAGKAATEREKTPPMRRYSSASEMGVS